MKQALIRDIYRQIANTWNRFAAIVLIVALGVGFVYGIKTTAPAMKYTADLYFDQQHFMDLHFLSNMGFTREDAEALRGQQGVTEVTATYCLDALIDSDSGVKPVRFHALPSQDDTGMNRPALTEGRWPTQANECVVDHKQAGIIGDIGSRIVVSAKNDEGTLDLLQSKQYVITGFVKSPEYINYARRGAISIGDGSIYCFIYIPEENFQSEYYSDLLAGVEGAAGLLSYSGGYTDLVEAAAQRLRDFADTREQARYEQITADATAELGKAEADLEAARREADQQNDKAREDLDAAQEELRQGQQQIDDSQQELAQAQTDLDQQKKELASRTTAAQTDINSAAGELEQQRQSYEEAAASLAQGYQMLDELNQQIQYLKNLGLPTTLLDQQAASQSQELQTRQAELDQAKAQLDAGDQELQARQSELNAAKGNGQAQIDGAQARIDENTALLEDANADLAAAQTEYDAALAEYQQALWDTEDSFREAEDRIQELRDQIDAIEKPQWYILTREDSVDYTSFGSDADRIDALSTVFPIFFYLIAALVCLTTLTRMVEEQRTQIGIFRALGYSRAAIASKYLLYAGSASILGSGLGIAAGHFVLPRLIYGTYEATYNIPELTVPFVLRLSLIYSLVAVLVNTLAAFWACYHEVAGVPALLIRPKAPAPGQRVLMERIPFLWSRMSFLVKVTVRNLFRFKKRFLMTVLGIAGCTALLLAGFGLRDSIAGTVPTQYYGLHGYHLFITLISPGSSARDSELNRSLDSLLQDRLYVTQIQVDIEGLDKKMVTYLFVPEEPERTGQFINFRDRKTREPLIFPQAGEVILTEKIALSLGVNRGDTVTILRDNADPVTLTVGGVTENYVYNYIYIAAEDYAAAFGSPPEYKMVLGKDLQGEDITEQQEKELVTELLGLDNVLSATTIPSIRREFDNAMKNLNAVVLVIILCACLLDFVVLYNLTNINISERTREIATIKVLGFFRREVSAYINREIITLTLAGILLGLAGGFFLHRFTIRTAEVDIVMFVRSIKPLSYGWAVLLTLLFTALINIAIGLRLRRIPMVESLKSVE